MTIVELSAWLIVLIVAAAAWYLALGWLLMAYDEWRVDYALWSEGNPRPARRLAAIARFLVLPVGVGAATALYAVIR